jgi:hypothetical protein
MNIEGIISISGKPGLFKVIAQTTARIIIEDIESKKRRPAFASDKVVSLQDITVFGHAEDLSLGEIFGKIYDKEEGKASISHKSDTEELRNHFETIWEDYNDEEVKDHDIKKIFQWYNKLVDNNMLTKESNSEEE